MKLKVALLAFVVLLVSAAGLVLYELSRMDTEAVVLCASGEGGIRIPSSACKHYLYNYRDMDSDVEQLAGGAGLIFILNGSMEERFEIAEHFLAHGLDINGINHYGEHNLTPLHHAVLVEDVRAVRFLLERGADVLSSLPSTGTPLEFAQSLQAQQPSEDRKAIVALLKSQVDRREPHEVSPRIRESWRELN